MPGSILAIDRLRHVADLGVRTLGGSFEAFGRPVPTVPVRVELVAPSGANWSWGRESARDVVRGAAEDLCLVLAGCRAVSEVSLRVSGVVASEWLAIAAPPHGSAPIALGGVRTPRTSSGRAAQSEDLTLT
ncbi:MAG: hypothetical protein JO100_07185 [Pseudonocardia sp.]|nr:hypothetical protein [Pseudonocardia sp.]